MSSRGPMNTNPEVIDVDSYVPDVAVTGQRVRVYHAIHIPKGRKVVRHLPQSHRKPKPKPQEPMVIDLTEDDDNNAPSSSRTSASSTSCAPKHVPTGVPRPKQDPSCYQFGPRSAHLPQSSNSESMQFEPSHISANESWVSGAFPSSPVKIGPPRGIKPNSPMPSRSSLARSHSSRPTNSQRGVAGPSSREAEEDAVDWETLYGALNINDESNWNAPVTKASGTPPVVSDFRDELEAAQEEARDSVYGSLKARARYDIRSVHKPHTNGFQLKPKLRAWPGIWNKVETASGPKHRPDSASALGVGHLVGSKEVKHLALLPGAVNSISQSGKFIAVTSCVADGLATTETGSIPYNREGTLVVIHEDKAVRLRGHQRQRMDPLNPLLDQTKHFSVSEAIFEPNCPEHLLSCGEDGRLFVWDCSTLHDGQDPRIIDMYNYPPEWIPRGMLFQPNSSVLAVTSNRGQVYVHRTSDLQNATILGVTPPPFTRGIQDIAWGTGATSGTLFVTSALDDYDHDHKGFFGGYHRVYDTSTGRMLFQLKNDDAGESVAVDPAGNILALATSMVSKASAAKDLRFDFALSLYDVRAHNASAASRAALEAFPVLTDDGRTALVQPRVNWLSFSPDGTYLAVARSDNRTQVFDARALARGAVYGFAHGAPTEGAQSDGLYGVYKVEWTAGRRGGLGLVSSGADGCVRLWDVHRSRGASTVLAQSTSYVSWFAMGDPLKGEKAVVLGDGGGNVVTKG